MSENVIISNPKKLEELIRKFKEDGRDKIHVLADFDRTLTKASVNGEKTPSIICILRDGNFLTSDYSAKAHALFDKYHPMEISSTLSLAEKKLAIDKWWREHIELLIKSGLKRKDLDGVIDSGKIKFRLGMDLFIKNLEISNIPLVIMSASGIGDYCINGLLKKSKLLNDDIYIISNSLEFDTEGKVTKFNEPFILPVNKDETIITRFPVYEKIKNRKNVILLGDNMEDIDMIIGFGYDNLIKIGFLNDKVEEKLETYKQNFDVVLINDTDMEYINNLLNQIL